MKKLFLLLTLVPFLSLGQTTTKFVEVNIGISTGIVPFFPGASALYGAEKKYPSGFLMEGEAGIAFPTLLTFKGGVGYDFDGTELSVGIRPWPASTYGQIKLNRPNKKSNIVLTMEGMWFANDLFVQRAIFTIGWRFDNKNRYSDIRNKTTK